MSPAQTLALIRHRHGDAFAEELVVRLERNEPLPEIAQHLGVHRVTVWRWRDRLGALQFVPHPAVRAITSRLDRQFV